MAKTRLVQVELNGKYKVIPELYLPKILGMNSEIKQVNFSDGQTYHDSEISFDNYGQAFSKMPNGMMLPLEGITSSSLEKTAQENIGAFLKQPDNRSIDEMSQLKAQKTYENKLLGEDNVGTYDYTSDKEKIDIANNPEAYGVSANGINEDKIKKMQENNFSNLGIELGLGTVKMINDVAYGLWDQMFTKTAASVRGLFNVDESYDENKKTVKNLPIFNAVEKAYADKNASLLENLPSSYSEGSIFSNIGNGNYKEAGFQLALGLANMIPQFAFSILTKKAPGVPIFLQTYGQNMGQLQKDNNLSEQKKEIVSVTKAGIEAALEGLTTQKLPDINKKAMAEIKDGIAYGWKHIGKEMGKETLIEGSGEGLTQLGQNIADKIFLPKDDPNRPNSIFDGVADAALIGGVAGGLFSSPLILNKNNENKQNVKDKGAISSITDNLTNLSDYPEISKAILDLADNVKSGNKEEVQKISDNLLSIIDKGDVPENLQELIMPKIKNALEISGIQITTSSDNVPEATEPKIEIKDKDIIDLGITKKIDAISKVINDMPEDEIANSSSNLSNLINKQIDTIIPDLTVLKDGGKINDALDLIEKIKESLPLTKLDAVDVEKINNKIKDIKLNLSLTATSPTTKDEELLSSIKDNPNAISGLDETTQLNIIKQNPSILAENPGIVKDLNGKALQEALTLFPDLIKWRDYKLPNLKMYEDIKEGNKTRAITDKNISDFLDKIVYAEEETPTPIQTNENINVPKVKIEEPVISEISKPKNILDENIRNINETTEKSLLNLQGKEISSEIAAKKFNKEFKDSPIFTELRDIPETSRSSIFNKEVTPILFRMQEDNDTKREFQLTNNVSYLLFNKEASLTDNRTGIYIPPEMFFNESGKDIGVILEDALSFQINLSKLIFKKLGTQIFQNEIKKLIPNYQTIVNKISKEFSLSKEDSSILLFSHIISPRYEAVRYDEIIGDLSMLLNGVKWIKEETKSKISDFLYGFNNIVRVLNSGEFDLFINSKNKFEYQKLDKIINDNAEIKDSELLHIQNMITKILFPTIKENANKFIDNYPVDSVSYGKNQKDLRILKESISREIQNMSKEEAIKLLNTIQTEAQPSGILSGYIISTLLSKIGNNLSFNEIYNISEYLTKGAGFSLYNKNKGSRGINYSSDIYINSRKMLNHISQGKKNREVASELYAVVFHEIGHSVSDFINSVDPNLMYEFWDIYNKNIDAKKRVEFQNLFKRVWNYKDKIETIGIVKNGNSNKYIGANEGFSEYLAYKAFDPDFWEKVKNYAEKDKGVYEKIKDFFIKTITSIRRLLLNLKWKNEFSTISSFIYAVKDIEALEDSLVKIMSLYFKENAIDYDVLNAVNVETIKGIQDGTIKLLNITNDKLSYLGAGTAASLYQYFLLKKQNNKPLTVSPNVFTCMIGHVIPNIKIQIPQIIDKIIGLSPEEQVDYLAKRILTTEFWKGIKQDNPNLNYGAIALSVSDYMINNENTLNDYEYNTLYTLYKAISLKSVPIRKDFEIRDRIYFEKSPDDNVGVNQALQMIEDKESKKYKADVNYKETLEKYNKIFSVFSEKQQKRKEVLMSEFKKLYETSNKDIVTEAAGFIYKNPEEQTIQELRDNIRILNMLFPLTKPALVIPEKGLIARNWQKAKIALMQSNSVLWDYSMAAIKRDGRSSLPDFANPILAASLGRGKAASACFKTINDANALINKFILEGCDFDKISLYVYARHGIERNEALFEKLGVENGSGLSTKAATEILNKEFTQDELIKYDNWARIWKSRFQDESLLAKYNAGIIDEELYLYLKNKFDLYFPLKTEPDGTVATDQKFFSSSSVYGSGIKTAKGRKTLAANPLVMAVVDNYKTHALVAANEAIVSMIKFAGEFPSPQNYVFRSSSIFNGLTDLASAINYVSPDHYVNLEEDEIQGFVNGKRYILKIKDKDLMHAFLRMQPLRDYEKIILSRISQANVLMRGLLTTYNLSFPIINFVRDIQTAVIKMGMMYGSEQALKTVANTIKLFGNYSNYKRYREEYLSSGGYQGYTRNTDYVAVEESLISSIKKSGKNNLAKEFFSGLAKIAQDYSSYLEDMTRVAVYKTVIDSGKITSKQAVFLARNITIDFSAGGRWKNVFNTLYLFSNANLQGIISMQQSLVTNSMPFGDGFALTKEGNEGKISIKAASAIVAMASIGALARMFILGLSDDDKDKYKDLPTYLKDNAMVIPISNGQYITIPYAFGFGSFFAMGGILSEIGLGLENPVNGLNRYVKTLLNFFNPLGGDPLTWQNYIFSLARPIASLASNKDWKGDAIYKSGDFYKSLPNSERGFKNENEIAVSFCKWLNRITGGSSKVSGGLDINPAFLTYPLKAYLGGVGTEALNLSECVGSIFNGEIPEIRNVPVFRRLLYSVNDSELIRKTYKLLEKSKNKLLSDAEDKDLRERLVRAKKNQAFNKESKIKNEEEYTKLLTAYETGRKNKLKSIKNNEEGKNE